MEYGRQDSDENQDFDRNHVSHKNHHPDKNQEAHLTVKEPTEHSNQFTHEDSDFKITVFAKTSAAAVKKW